MALAGSLVAGAIALMKIVPGVPGSFGVGEWTVLALWCGVSALLWARRRRP